MKPILLLCLFVVAFVNAISSHVTEPKKQTPKVVLFDIKEQIAPSATRLVTKALQRARQEQADLIVIDMDTYGGLVNEADSIRYALLRSTIPVVVYINPNAASAGALISIACDRIYMSPGANIGAATVVTQDGQAAPDKFQSYMRSMMRATASAQGKDTLPDGSIQWRRNPLIAEAMVDQDVEIEGITEKGKVLTFTPEEALLHGFCDDMAENLNQVYELEGLQDFDLIRVEKNTLDLIFGFFKNPAVSGILVLLILGGIYYELQTPGLGFPILVSIIASLLYFAPYYIDGLATHWEIIMFIVGVVLIAIEIFVLPGFGVAGILGVMMVLASLILSMIANDGLDFTLQSPNQIGVAFSTVTLAIAALTALIIFTGASLHKSRLLKKVGLETTLQDAYNARDTWDSLAGSDGIAITDLKPQGKVRVQDTQLSAHSLSGLIPKGAQIKLIRKENNIWRVDKIG